MNILNKLKFSASKIKRSDFSGFTIRLPRKYQCEFVFFKKIIPLTIAIDKYTHKRLSTPIYLLNFDIRKITN